MNIDRKSANRTRKHLLYGDVRVFLIRSICITNQGESFVLKACTGSQEPIFVKDTWKSLEWLLGDQEGAALTERSNLQTTMA